MPSVIGAHRANPRLFEARVLGCRFDLPHRRLKSLKSVGSGIVRLRFTERHRSARLRTYVDKGAAWIWVRAKELSSNNETITARVDYA